MVPKMEFADLVDKFGFLGFENLSSTLGQLILGDSESMRVSVSVKIGIRGSYCYICTFVICKFDQQT